MICGDQKAALILRAQKFFLLSSLLTTLLPLPAPSQQSFRSLDDTLALIGNKVITAEMFASLYKEKLVTLGLYDNGETRMKFLSNLVDDEILIARAKRLRLNRTKEATSEYHRLYLQELLNAYSTKHISQNLQVTEDDLKELFVRMNTKAKVRYLYAATRLEADRLYERVSSGASFDELAKNVFSDPRLREGGGSLGYISFDEMDPDFERAAFTLNVGEISPPIKTVEGYSIIRVDDVKRNPFTTEYEYLKKRERLQALARKRKYEEMTKQFTFALRAQLQIQYDDALIARLYELTRKESWQRLVEQTSSSLSKDSKKTLVRWTQGSWTVRKLIQVLKANSPRQVRWIHSKEDFEDFIAGLVMRSHISQLATKEKLDSMPLFHAKVEHAFDSFLLKTIEADIKKHISFSPDSLRSFYELNKVRFVLPAEIRMSAILIDRISLTDSIRTMLQEGMPFDVLARRYSIQRVTAEAGGDLGYFRKTELSPLGEDITGMQPGEWRGPFAQDGKYLFLKCTGFKPPIQRSFGESSKEIEDTLVTLAWYRIRRESVESFKKMLRCSVYRERVIAVPLSLSQN